MKNFSSIQLNSELQQLESNLNRTVEAFHTFQPFEKIESAEQAVLLVQDPQDYYDQVIMKHLNILSQSETARRVLAKQAAFRHKIDRPGYQDAIRVPVNCDQYPEYEALQLSPEMVSFFDWDNGEFRIKAGVIPSPQIDQPEFFDNITL